MSVWVSPACASKPVKVLKLGWRARASDRLLVPGVLAQPTRVRAHAATNKARRVVVREKWIMRMLESGKPQAYEYRVTLL